MAKMPYFKPKSMVYTGNQKQTETIIKHYHYDVSSMTEDQLIDKGVVHKSYIQVIGLSDIEKMKTIQERYQIESFVMEDILNVNQRIKIEFTDHYIFTTLAVRYLLDNQIKTDYLSMYVTKDTVITFHETEPHYLDDIVGLLHDYVELQAHGADMLFYHILDVITDQHLEVFDYLELRVNQFEEEVLESKTLEQEPFYLLRKKMLQLHSIISPLFEQSEKMLSKRLPLLTEDTTNYFQDLKDHLKRLDNKLFQARDTMRQLLDLHMNNQSTKMNRIMSTLTLFSAIFIPLSFLTGFFGMNFHNFDALDYRYAITVFIIVCVVIASGMLLFFKKRRWF